MQHAYWNDWYFGWGWLLWFGFIFLLFSSFGANPRNQEESTPWTTHSH